MSVIYNPAEPLQNFLVEDDLPQWRNAAAKAVFPLLAGSFLAGGAIYCTRLGVDRIRLNHQMECRSSTDLDTKRLAGTMITERQLIEIVKYALRHHNFREYQRLKADGSLDVVAQLRAETALETRDYLMILARDEALSSDLDSMDRVSRQMRKNREANAIAIAQATEFEPTMLTLKKSVPKSGTATVTICATNQCQQVRACTTLRHA